MPKPHQLTRQGREQGKGNAACCWCKDDHPGEPHPITGRVHGPFCSEQCRHEYQEMQFRGYLPWRGVVTEGGGLDDFFLTFWERQRSDLMARKPEALHFLLSGQLAAWVQLSGLEDYEGVRSALLKLWEVRFGELVPLRTPCPKCGEADPGAFWQDRKYCIACEEAWRSARQARKEAR